MTSCRFYRPRLSARELRIADGDGRLTRQTDRICNIGPYLANHSCSRGRVSWLTMRRECPQNTESTCSGPGTYRSGEAPGSRTMSLNKLHISRSTKTEIPATDSFHGDRTVARAKSIRSCNRDISVSGYSTNVNERGREDLTGSYKSCDYNPVGLRCLCRCK